MKTLITLTLLCCCLAPARAAGDCAGNSDACAASSRTVSPFLAAAAAEPAPAKRPAAVKKAVAAPVAAAPAEVSVSSGAPAASSGPGSSSPLWLLFIGGAVAGLYFYLAGGVKKRKSK